MKVICIKNFDPTYLMRWYHPLTIGKIYETDGIFDPILIINDIGNLDFYPENWFISIEEYRQINRDKKLEKLGI